jgi:predicted SnoaL-like aldol condensation-catalyzing enzyme
MNQTELRNRAFALEAFDTLFNKRDYAGAERYWSPSYIQHSANVGPGREGLFDLVRGTPETMRYESGLIMAEGDFLMVHGRYSGLGDAPSWVAVDIVRIEGGLLAEHWDVIQDEASRAASKSGLPMFSDKFTR